MLNAPPSPSTSSIGCCMLRRSPPRPPQEIYFESRGKCCKKLLRYNGYPNKVYLSAIFWRFNRKLTYGSYLFRYCCIRKKAGPEMHRLVTGQYRHASGGKTLASLRKLRDLGSKSFLYFYY